MADKNPSDPQPKSPAEHVVDIAAKEHWKKGNSFFEESKFNEAMMEYNEALKIDEKYADAYFNRALTERVTNDFDAAKRDLEMVLSLQPKSADAPLLIGDIAESANDLIGARYWYEKSLANNPDYSEAKNRLEHIDSLIHVDSGIGGKGTGSQQMEMSKPEQKEVIQEGQIKSVAFFKSDVKFTDVIGLEKIKRYLADNVVLAIKKPDLFKKYGKKLGVGLLLYGPPGTGKTYIVRAVAGEAGANVIIARVNQIVDMYTGNTEKNLHAIFEQARKNTPCVIFFDELDALGVKRGGDEPGGGNSSALRLAVNQFLVEMSGVEANPEGIYVIGATNNPWDIDPALKRSGRFGDSVYLKPPDYKARRDLFKYYTRNKPVGRLDFGRLARATMGYSPADIERIADKAAMLPLLHEYEHNTSREYTMKDVLSILKDKDYSGSSLDEWYSMVKKDVITKTETQMVDGKKQEIVKEGKLDPQEKILYKAMVNDIKKNTNSLRIRIKKMIRWFALNLF
ncbi:TPA: AAA family ATPase [Candidatus Micrarchaeota archaeon]|jgi:SpoVK/Ycf46/Vps4 family AAA+-type ATPase|nr:AAA family ATPase [Candidatus Micrarchaeota archaeon]